MSSPERTELPARRLPRAQGPPPRPTRSARCCSLRRDRRDRRRRSGTPRSVDARGRDARTPRSTRQYTDAATPHRAGQADAGEAAEDRPPGRADGVAGREGPAQQPAGGVHQLAAAGRVAAGPARSESRAKRRPPPPAPKTAFEQRRPPLGRRDAAAAAARPSRSVRRDHKLTGIADTDVQVAQFISKLNASQLLKDVNLVITDEFKQGDRRAAPVPDRDDARTPTPRSTPTSGDQKTKTAAVEL